MRLFGKLNPVARLGRSSTFLICECCVINYDSHNSSKSLDHQLHHLQIYAILFLTLFSC